MKRKKKILQREEASQDSRGAEPGSVGGKTNTEEAQVKEERESVGKASWVYEWAGQG